VLLEEAILYLLRSSGYTTVTAPDNVTTRRAFGGGLQVRGRGGEHQIDAIADFTITPPFTNPQRLIVEAKCYARKEVGLDVVRNGVGVLKDISEFWAAPDESSIGKRRYHYQYAIFSASEFSLSAQRYAYAHDVHLLPLRRSVFLQPVIQAIMETSRMVGYARSPAVDSRARFRPAARPDTARLRHVLRDALLTHPDGVATPEEARFLEPLISACRRVGTAVIAMIGNAIPVFLMSDPTLDLSELLPFTRVRYTWDEQGWYISASHDGRRLFSFDLPVEVVRLYAASGTLTPPEALDLKATILSNLQAVAVIDGRTQVLHMDLDQRWLAEVRRTGR
jgi:hypothetical protein